MRILLQLKIQKNVLNRARLPTLKNVFMVVHNKIGNKTQVICTHVLNGKWGSRQGAQGPGVGGQT